MQKTTKDKPSWFTASQEKWLEYIKFGTRSFFQRRFSYHSYITDSESIQKIKHFVDCTKNEELPDQEVLKWISDNFEQYLNGKSLSLESAFKLKSKPKKGNPAQQYQKDKDTNELLMCMAKRIVNNSNKYSQEEIADQALNETGNSTIDATTLARYYRAWPTRSDAETLYKIEKSKIG